MRVYVNGIKVVGSNSWLTVNTDNFELKNVVDLNLAGSYLVELRTSNGLNELNRNIWNLKGIYMNR